MSFIRIFLVTAGLASLPAGAAPRGREVLQTVHEYFNLKEILASSTDASPVVNGFLNYTHIGTDFGFVGPGELSFCLEAGAVCADFTAKPASWGGVWHSLNGLARENVPMDLHAPYPDLVRAEFQPRVVGVQAVVAGSGNFKVELEAPRQADDFGDPPGWSHTFVLDGDEKLRTVSVGIGKDIRHAQTLNWVAEPGAKITVDSVALQMELPDVDFPSYVFLASYAKLARCYSAQTGMIRDRAHIGPESLNNVPATGMFALATAAAQRLGVVEEAVARATLRRILRVVESLPRQRGILPHFVLRENGAWVLLPGAEYSTIDTALCLISLRLAANVLGDSESAARALELLRAVDIPALRNAEGYVIHGLHEDGEPLAHFWRDWGGETALVLMMQRIAGGEGFLPQMEGSGRTHRGIGFIAELPALFFPQFNTNARAHAGSVEWGAYRQRRLAEQKAYFATHAPQSLAAQLGLYGLSAGEGEHGIGYHTGGVEDSDQRLIFPHYILMSSLMESTPAAVYEILQKLEAHGWFTPWGLVENIAAGGESYVPMISSLNACFESLAAYHLLLAHRGQVNPLYQAATEDEVFADAIKAVLE
jgi:hypothetical protein